MTNEKLDELLIWIASYEQCNDIVHVTQYNDFIQKCKAALIEAKKDEWQPIEAAPKDGSKILIYDYEWNATDVVKWVDDKNAYGGKAGWSDGSQYVADCDCKSEADDCKYYVYYRGAIYWKPLPNPPKE